MARRPTLTAAGRRAVLGAETGSGLLHAPAQVLARLVAQGLAARHPRPPHRHYLTPTGQELRRELARTAPEPGDPAPRQRAEAGPFAALTGDQPAPPGDPAARAREVRTAFDGLRELRRMTGKDGSTELPCPWERSHLVPAAALALEAAGLRPGAVDEAGRRVSTGYRVTLAEHQPEAVRIAWPPAPGDEPAPGTALRELVRCAAALERSGWQVSEHPQRDGTLYLLASPRRA
ncbi:hypothetical protein [Streptomyces boninensis]|uniref:hypothetical protein n=1 Tax=Streptomyces boninensis TaxID=2039455 RepID=UPI003B228471